MPSTEAHNRSLSERVRLNRQILENKYWFLPVDDKGHENYVPVGRGARSSDWCGKSRGLVVCKNIEGHKGVVVKGADCSGKVFVRQQHFWCKNAQCPVCFIRGWSVRGAKFIFRRLEAGAKSGFGKVEHLVVSVSEADSNLNESVLRKKCRCVLLGCGVLGGCMIFHGYRIDRERNCLKWSPHYHVLGFIRGGYDRCRHCQGGDCYACDGVEGRCYRAYRDNGYIVRVLEERKTEFGTAWYQMNHSTLRLGLRRFHVVTWFGVTGYNNFKSEKTRTGVIPCLACGEEMVRSVHVGKRRIVKDLGDAGYKSVFADEEFDESGQPNYVESVGGHGLE